MALETFDRTPQTIELIDRLGVEVPFLKQLATSLQNELANPYSPNLLYIKSLQNVIVVHLLRHHCKVQFCELKLLTRLG